MDFHEATTAKRKTKNIVLNEKEFEGQTNGKRDEDFEQNQVHIHYEIFNFLLPQLNFSM